MRKAYEKLFRVPLKDSTNVEVKNIQEIFFEKLLF